MKILTTTIIIIYILSACQKKTENDSTTNDTTATDSKTETAVSQSDSLMINDVAIIDNSFDLGDQPLDYLVANVKVISKIDTTDHFDESDKGEQKSGTFYRVNYGEEFIGVYKRFDDSVQFLTSVFLKTNKISTRHGIRVGMTKSEVANLLGALKISKIPSLLLIGSLEDPLLRLRFKDDKLVEIYYSAYLD